VNLNVVAQAAHSVYSPWVIDPLGGPEPRWVDAGPVDSFGWWQPTADELGIESGRRSEEVSRVLLVPAGTACGDKDRWTIPGDGTFEQVGGPQDNSRGPFGMQTPLIVYLKTVEG